MSVTVTVHFPPPPKRRAGWIRFESGGRVWLAQGAVFMKYTPFAWRQFLRAPNAQMRFEGGCEIRREGDEVVFSSPAQPSWRVSARQCEAPFADISEKVSEWLSRWVAKPDGGKRTRPRRKIEPPSGTGIPTN